MKPKVMHQQAMEFSFKARQALAEGHSAEAFEFYRQAAVLEGQVADFYFDKPELEPTRSIIIRSAAFLNLKAGMIKPAKRYIFFGLLNSKDEKIQTQLNNALEVAVSLGSLSFEHAGTEYNYLNLLRQRSIHYTLEPSMSTFGQSVSLKDIRDFSDGYLKSLKAFAKSQFHRLFSGKQDISEKIEKWINPLVTSSAYGSFKFSIANDFLSREGEAREIVHLKTNIVVRYHNEIFVNPLEDPDIGTIREQYAVEEINEIFKPLSKIKSARTSYRIGYYDPDSFEKKFVNTILHRQKKKLLIMNSISQEDIGELESNIVHKRSLSSGKVKTKTIKRELLKSFEFDHPVKVISPKGKAPVILHEEIFLNIQFDSQSGFRIIFEDLRLEFMNTEFEAGLADFHAGFYRKLIRLANLSEKNEVQSREWEIIESLIGNPNPFKK